MKLEVGCPTEREAQQYGLQYAETTGIVPWVKTEPNIIGSGLVRLCVEAMFLHTHTDNGQLSQREYFNQGFSNKNPIKTVGSISIPTQLTSKYWRTFIFDFLSSKM